MFILQLIVNLYIFFLGVLGVLTNRRLFLVIRLCIEITLVSITTFFLFFLAGFNNILVQFNFGLENISRFNYFFLYEKKTFVNNFG